MAKVIITAKIMPDSPKDESGMKTFEDAIVKEIKTLIGDAEMRVKHEPLAFGLIAVVITFIWEENLGSPEDVIVPKLQPIDGFNSFEMTDVRRAIG